MSNELRTTKYSTAVLRYMISKKHATNSELVFALRDIWPDISATTIHRITVRLAKNGILGVAPKDSLGNLRYDANPAPHHHFYCACCNTLHDIELDISLLRKLEESLGGCRLKGQLIINGDCGKCVIAHEKGVGNGKNNSI